MRREVRPAGKSAGVDHLGLAPAQRLDVAHEAQRVAHTRADVGAAPPGGGVEIPCLAGSDRHAPLTGVHADDARWRSGHLDLPRYAGSRQAVLVQDLGLYRVRRSGRRGGRGTEPQLPGARDLSPVEEPGTLERIAVVGVGGLDAKRDRAVLLDAHHGVW